MEYPIGGITMWSGMIADIPSGFAFCDGTNGTPNMMGRFVLGAGPGQENDQGGDWSHTHTVAVDAHDHSLQGNAPVGPSPGILVTTDTTDRKATGMRAASGTTDLVPVIPPYYSLAYIMRKS